MKEAVLIKSIQEVYGLERDGIGDLNGIILKLDIKSFRNRCHMGEPILKSPKMMTVVMILVTIKILWMSLEQWKI